MCGFEEGVCQTVFVVLINTPLHKLAISHIVSNHCGSRLCHRMNVFHKLVLQALKNSKQ